jgi:hypothetical protein
MLKGHWCCFELEIREVGDDYSICKQIPFYKHKSNISPWRGMLHVDLGNDVFLLVIAYEAFYFKE